MSFPYLPNQHCHFCGTRTSDTSLNCRSKVVSKKNRKPLPKSLLMLVDSIYYSIASYSPNIANDKKHISRRKSPGPSFLITGCRVTARSFSGSYGSIGFPLQPRRKKSPAMTGTPNDQELCWWFLIVYPHHLTRYDLNSIPLDAREFSRERDLFRFVCVRLKGLRSIFVDTT